MVETYDVTQALDQALIGKPVKRYEARAKVTGKARYAADEPLPGTLYAALVTTDVPKGRITGYDLAAAEAVPGVRLVMTHENVPKLADVQVYAQGGMMQSGLPQLQTKDIRFAGQIVAVTVAETIEDARRAAELVRVDVTPSGGAVASMHAPGTEKPTPVPEQAYEPIERGDVEGAFSDADASVEAEYATPNQHHNAIELYAASVEWRNGALTAYVPSQWVAGFRAGFATAFGLPTDKVVVRSAYVGGGFGGKGTMPDHALLTAAAARMVDAPVKLYVTRDEGFTVASNRGQTSHRLRVAAKNGRLTAIDHTQDSQTSEFDTFFLPGTEQTSRLYDWQAIRTAERVVPTNVNTPGFMRAPAEVPALFALESAVDELAWKLGADPVALRLASNAAEREPVDGLPWTSNNLAACLERGAEAFGWEGRDRKVRGLRRDGLMVGHGVATAIYPSYTRAASAEVRYASDGSVRVMAAAHELGGGTYTVLQQIASSELGVPMEDVRVDMGSSDLPVNGVAGGSTQTASVGSAVLNACREARRQLAEAATKKGGPFEGRSPEGLRSSGGEARLGSQSAPLEEAFRNVPFGVIEARGTWVPQAAGEKSVREFYRSGGGGQVGFTTDDYARAAFGAQFVEVTVDPRTHEIRVSRMTGAFACGRITNERTARGQLMGSMIWGVGSVLHEATEIDTRHARFVNTDLGEYHVPVNADVPQVDVIMVEEVDEHVNPLGVKGIGEIGITGVNAAIANAVYHATGVRVREVPLLMEKVIGGTA